MSIHPTTRFSERVQDYVRYRPGYPAAVVASLENQYGLNNKKKVADIGSGTGISCQLFLDRGYDVIGIEPNQAMRDKSIELLQQYPAFLAKDGSAEATGLDTQSIDLIIAGQAFHWFDQAACRKEFDRIIKPGGILALIWNERLVSSEFEIAYEQLIRSFATDYTDVDHRRIDEAGLQRFFHPAICRLEEFSNYQEFDFEGLSGRLASSSYMPLPGTGNYDKMREELKQLFDRYQEGGRIRINYSTKLYSGILKAAH